MRISQHIDTSDTDVSTLLNTGEELVLCPYVQSSFPTQDILRYLMSLVPCMLYAVRRYREVVSAMRYLNQHAHHAVIVAD